jgi:integrase
MSVYQRTWKDKHGRERSAWCVDVDFKAPDGSGSRRIRETSPVNTRRGAEDYERQLRNSLLAGTYGKKRDTAPTLEEFSKAFLEHADTNNKPATRSAKDGILRNHLLPALGKKRLDQIGAEEVERFKAAKLKEGIKPKTLNNFLTVLRKLLALAVEWGRLDKLPRVKWMRAPAAEFDFLTAKELEQLLATSEEAWRPMLTVAGHTGLRLGELRALRWESVDLKAGRLVVRHNVWKEEEGTPKGGRTREVPLSSRAAEALKAQEKRASGPYVFHKDGERHTEGECKWPIRRACEAAKLRGIGWHTLRHTFASLLVMRGRHLKEVQELLGHADIKMTMRYAHLAPQAKRDAVSVLDLPAE